MKTAVSIPDELFHAADRLADRLDKSRSQLYAEALEAYVVRADPETRTEQINEVCRAIYDADEPDPFVTAAAYHVFKDVEWT